MAIRLASVRDIEAVLAVYEAARGFMKRSGNSVQWGSAYPPRELVEKDISQGNLFVLEQDGDIYGVFAFFVNGDWVYDKIQGEWLNTEPYAAIHRVASNGTHKGVLAQCVEFCLGFSRNLKIDTHSQNLPMQAALKKQGFVPCGTVYYSPSEPRIAFQLSV